MELIELDATAQRALELLTNAGMSDGSIYDYGSRVLCKIWKNGKERLPGSPGTHSSAHDAAHTGNALISVRDAHGASVSISWSLTG